MRTEGMKSKRLLDLMAAGHRTVDALVTESGFSRDVVTRALVNLRWRGYIATAPEIHSLTSKGEERQRFVPKTPKPLRDRQSHLRMARNERQQGAHLTEEAIASQPLLARCWGAPMGEAA